MATALADIEAVEDEDAGDSKRLSEVFERAITRFDETVMPQTTSR